MSAHPSPAESAPTIYHNPACGTSRNVLALLRAAGPEPVVVEYLRTPPDRPTLERLLRDMGIGPRGLLRRKGTPYDALQLDDPAKGDDLLIEAILAHPILMERPVVVTARGTALCRPAEKVLDLLERLPPGPFAKEDGTPVIDAAGRRLL